MSEEEEAAAGPAEYGLVMPFTAVRSKGGPYDDEAFVAGWTCGALDLILEALAAKGGDEHCAVVLATLVEQADLIAMKHGWAAHVDPVEEHGYRHIRFTRGVDKL